ncbi:MAG TPA: hypothetical protein PLR65_16415, partial [Anaerolineales bacterium]|nr:hypothetical protein [Anaerolineales bacterium]
NPIRVPRDGLLNFKIVFLPLRADRRADKVRPVGISALLSHEVYLPKIHGAHVDGDFFGLCHNISLPSTWMVYG